MTNFSIKVISDTICPFCYLGKKRLEKAIEVYKMTTPSGSSDTFTVTWHPFYLDPTLSGPSLPVNEAMARKFGPDRVSFLNARMKAMGAAEGIDFSFQGRLGNTRDSHRLVQLAKTKDPEAQDKVVNSLFRSYFEEGGDVTSVDMLVAAGVKAGLDGREVREWLENGKGGKEVDEEVEVAYRKGVHGVPHFIINDEFEIGGAQDVGTFLEEFAMVKEAAAGSRKGTEKAGDSSMCC